MQPTPTNETATSSRHYHTIRASLASKRTINPIRQIVDKLNPKDAHPDKSLISLSIGDPTVFGVFDTDEHVLNSVQHAITSKKFNGYAHACGFAQARRAVADKFSLENVPLDPERDVVLTSGCSGAIDMIIDALANPGDNILIPMPGFSLYQTCCGHKGVEAKSYPLLPDRDWECDLEGLEKLIDERTRAILVTNPSNPCGSVYSKEHLEKVLAIAEKHCLPVIADEIYGGMVFSGRTFYPMGNINPNVPVISVGGLAKQYLVPGWRIGWILVYDRNGYLNDVRDGLARLATLILGPNTLIQGALPEILQNTPQSFYDEVNAKLERHAEYSVERISKMQGLKVIRPSGAMYLMVRIELDQFNKESGIVDDVTFCQHILKEESLVLLPGQCFRIKGYFRIVFCPSLEKLKEAYDRLEAFCLRHTTPL